MTIYKCNKCGSTDLHCGWDVMVPVNKESLELLDFLDGERYLDHVVCEGCGEDNVMMVEEETQNE